jgi:hypothetical protein
VTPPKWLCLLYFSLKKAPHTKKFGKAPPEEPEPELRRSPTKHVLNIYSDPIPPS